MKDDVSQAAAHLLDISRGFSILDLKGESYYFRHFSLREMLEFDEFQQIEFKKAVKTGIQTEADLIESAIEMGSWSKEKEEKIKSLKWMIDRSTKALEKMSDLNQRRVFTAQIDGDRKKLEELSQSRAKISSYSAEHLSEQKRFDKMIVSALFYDEEFQNPVEDEKRLELASLVFNKFATLSNKKNVLLAIYKSYFFDVFTAQSHNPLKLFGNSFLSLTVFQKGLLSYANALLNKMKNVRIPDEIVGDPIKIFDYEEPKDTEKKVSHGLDDLKQKMEMRGGELKAEDLLT
tara:strand:- start:2321 stop:3190 length:870 start_codon:yes stop_codon:yes gene_type:complete